jgi:hypothetical protein
MLDASDVSGLFCRLVWDLRIMSLCIMRFLGIVQVVQLHYLNIILTNHHVVIGLHRSFPLHICMYFLFFSLSLYNAELAAAWWSLSVSTRSTNHWYWLTLVWSYFFVHGILKKSSWHCRSAFVCTGACSRAEILACVNDKLSDLVYLCWAILPRQPLAST